MVLAVFYRGSSPRRVTKKKDTTFVVSFFLSCAPMRWRSPSKPKMLSRSEFYLRWGFLSVAKMRIQYKSAAPLRRYLALYTTKAPIKSQSFVFKELQSILLNWQPISLCHVYTRRNWPDQNWNIENISARSPRAGLIFPVKRTQPP